MRPDPSPDLDRLVEVAHRHAIDADLDPIDDADAVLARLRATAPLLTAADETRVLARVADRIAGLGPLAPLLADDATTDVLVNGPGRVWIERGGQVEATEVTVDEHELHRIIDRLTAPSGRRVDRRNPLVDLRLHDGSRAHVVLPPVAVEGPYLTIRRFGDAGFDLESFAGTPAVDLLVDAVRRRANILISGGTGSGKTSLLNALCAHLPDGIRTITIEDAAELRLPGRHVVRLETRPASAEGLEAVSIGDLVRAALRMRPDRIIVGEVRGAEALDMLSAMNTGHDGSMTTCHANGPADALDRLETMALTARSGLDHPGVRRRIHAAIDLVVHVERSAGSTRRVVAISEPPGPADEEAAALRRLSDGRRLLEPPRRQARS